MGVGSWPLGVDFSASRCRLFLSLGVDFGFRESILSLWGRFWDSLGSDVGDLGAHFGILEVIFSPERQMYAIEF